MPSLLMSPSPPAVATLPLHDALPISVRHAATAVTVTLERGWDAATVRIANDGPPIPAADRARIFERFVRLEAGPGGARSEEHTSELQSLRHLVCRLLLEKKKK